MLPAGAGRLCSEKAGNAEQTLKWAGSGPSQRHVGSARPGSGRLWSLRCCRGVKLCFFLSHAFPPVSHPGCSDPQGFSFPVLPLAMMEHSNHPGPDRVEGPPCAQIQVGTTTRRAIVITGSPLQSPHSPRQFLPQPWLPAQGGRDPRV